MAGRQNIWRHTFSRAPANNFSPTFIPPSRPSSSTRGTSAARALLVHRNVSSQIAKLPPYLAEYGRLYEKDNSISLFKSRSALIRHLMSQDDQQWIAVTNLPLFATSDDVHELFEESGHAIAKILMAHQGNTGNNSAHCLVLLSNPDEYTSVFRDLQGAALFNSRVVINRANIRRMSPVHSDDPPTFDWGWQASPSPALEKIVPRKPWLSFPTDIFASIREQRRIVVASTVKGYIGHELRELYSLLHAFDVTCVERRDTMDLRSKQQGVNYYVNFATREEAQVAQMKLQGLRLWGQVCAVYSYQVPLKHLGGMSWNNAMPGTHYSGRDQGSAVDTNFEFMQEEVFRKATLGTRDRKLWVADHQYR